VDEVVIVLVVVDTLVLVVVEVTVVFPELTAMYAPAAMTTTTKITAIAMTEELTPLLLMFIFVQRANHNEIYGCPTYSNVGYWEHRKYRARGREDYLRALMPSLLLGGSGQSQTVRESCSVVEPAEATFNIDA
jgi:hypothetical protein